MSRTAARWADDSGQVGGIEALPFCVLIFVVGSLLIVNVWGVVDAKFATTSAAREASRVYVESDTIEQARAAGADAARRVMEGHGRDPDRAEISFAHRGDQPFERCARIEATVAYRVPAIRLPFIGGYGSAFRVESRHSEVVDPFRDGLPAAGGCG